MRERMLKLISVAGGDAYRRQEGEWNEYSGLPFALRTWSSVSPTASASVFIFWICRQQQRSSRERLSVLRCLLRRPPDLNEHALGELAVQRLAHRALDVLLVPDSSTAACRMAPLPCPSLPFPSYLFMTTDMSPRAALAGSSARNCCCDFPSMPAMAAAWRRP